MVEFKKCHDPECPHKGRHTHPAGPSSEAYWLRILQALLQEQKSLNTRIAHAAAELVAARARQAGAR